MVRGGTAAGLGGSEKSTLSKADRGRETRGICGGRWNHLNTGRGSFWVSFRHCRSSGTRTQSPVLKKCRAAWMDAMTMTISTATAHSRTRRRLRPQRLTRWMRCCRDWQVGELQKRLLKLKVIGGYVRRGQDAADCGGTTRLDRSIPVWSLRRRKSSKRYAPRVSSKTSRTQLCHPANAESA